MEFEQLCQLDALARCGTISAAAKERHISQPAFSRSMQRLEEEFEQPLFDRRGRTIALNDAGNIALDYARQILRDKRLMREALTSYARKSRAMLVGSVAPAPLWRLTALMMELSPEAILTSETLEENEVERRILDKSIDFGISLKPCGLPTVRCCQLMTESLSVALPENHPLAHRSSISAEELDGETFLLFRQIGFWHSFCKTHFPASTFVVQEDRTMFDQLMPTTKLLFFVSNVPALASRVPANRVIVPLRDAAAHATYYLLVSENSSPELQNAFDWIRKHP